MGSAQTRQGQRPWNPGDLRPMNLRKKMRRIKFHTELDDNYYDELFIGISSYTIEFHENFREPIGVWLNNLAGVHFHIQCDMIDICPRFEVGTLSISRKDLFPDSIVPVLLSEKWRHIKKIERLDIIEGRNSEDKIITEAGLLFENINGERLIILHGTAPYTLAAKINDDEKYFNPQYKPHEYNYTSIMR